MRYVIRLLWLDDHGALLTTEFVLLATVLIIGIISGLVMVRDSVVVQLEELGLAIGALCFLGPMPSSTDPDRCHSACGTLTSLPAFPCTIDAASCP